MRVVYLGKEIPLDELPDAPPAPEVYFADPILSPRAIDRASQIVPEHHWKATGLHTWLLGRAKRAFEKLKVGEKEVMFGKLKYRFHYDDPRRPTLETVMLV